MEAWIVKRITLKCPKCGNEFTDEGDEAVMDCTCSSIMCDKCDFEGEVPCY